MRVFYDRRQSVKSNKSFSPSAQKSALLAQEWKRLGFPVTFKSFKPVKNTDLYRIHDRDYVDGVLSGNRDNGYGNRSLAVARSLNWVCGSFVSAVEFSIKTGRDSWSLSAGAHHAHYRHGAGFCSYNFLCLGALHARDMGSKRTLLLDFDMHFPDGCRDIKKQIGIPELEIYAFADQNIDSVAQTEAWLKELPSILLGLLDGVDIVFYNAGVDCAETDPLGGVMTAEQMARRDRCVFETAKFFGTDCVVSLAGGYSKDSDGGIGPTLNLHTQTLLQYFAAHSITGTRGKNEPS